jgi:hypothetical protein
VGTTACIPQDGRDAFGQRARGIDAGGFPAGAAHLQSGRLSFVRSARWAYMAGKGGKKKDASDAPKKAGSGKLLALVQMVCAVLAVLSAAVLALGAFNVGSAALADTLHAIALVPIALLVICGFAVIFTASGVRAGELRRLEEQLAEMEARLDGRVAEAVAKVDTHIGDDYQAVRENNKLLQEKLEQFQQAEKNKMVEEMDKLRALNGELEEQIKKWAIGSVDQLVSEPGTEGIKVA